MFALDQSCARLCKCSIQPEQNDDPPTFLPHIKCLLYASCSRCCLVSGQCLWHLPKQDRKGFKSSVPVLISTKKDVMANRKKFRDATSLIFKKSYDLYALVIQSVLCSRKRHPQRTQKETVLISQMCIIIKWLTLPAATLFQCSCSFGKPAVTCSLLSLLWGWCSKWDYWELLIPGLATFFVHLIDKAHWAFLHQLLSGMQDVISGAPESFS